jgi:DNA mismatch repair protein MutS2
VVPLTLELSHKERILVISGPNAGGKSICLKTIGLLQYMLQCGLLIPANENSEFGIFRTILIDIGDEQSLENDLSTYTSHLQNLKVFLRNADRHTLFLIDEFGTGTEPNLGGAIAEATLETLNNKKAWGVVTTHYANLKLMSGQHQGIINGAMLFDSKKLQPLFILKTGKPGSSFAFEMARKIGFPEDILDLAGTKTGKKQLDFDQQLHQLEIEKKDLSQKQSEVTVADDLLKELLDKYRNRILELDKERKRIISEAQAEADSMIIAANTRIERTIKEIRETQAEKEKTRKLREKLKASAGEKIKKNHDALRTLKQELEEVAPKEETVPVSTTPEKSKHIYKVGDHVRMQGQRSVGIITGLKGKKATIEFDSLSLKADIQTLEPAQPEKHKKEQVRLTTSTSGNIVHDLTTKAANFKISIDVRGQRAEEAILNISKYLDDAILLNVPEIKILHGKGNGILRDVIREYLNSLQEVRKYKDEALEFGGNGITIVSLRY